MKNIIDFYEDAGLNVTPDSAIGMGNPMPATNDQPGSEPMIVKSKKRHKKCCEKDIREGILSDIDTQISGNDELLNFATWCVSSQYNENKGKGELNSKAIAVVVNCTKQVSKNEWMIDLNKIYDLKDFGDLFKDYDPTLFLIPKSGVPKNIKKLTYINAKWGGVRMHSYIADLSGLTIEVFSDNKKTLGDLTVAFKMQSAGNNIKFGNVVCNEFKLSHLGLKELTIKDNTILNVNLANCAELEIINARFGSADDVRVSKKFIKHTLANNGFIPWGCNLSVYH